MTRTLDTLTESDVAGVRAHSQHCAACKVRQYPCSGACACVDGIDVVLHQAAGYCPHPDGAKFGGAKPTGWRKMPKADAKTSAAVPESQWPWAVRVVARQRRDGEAGVGDTAKRVLAKLGAESLKWLYEKATGRDCGCGDRQAKLNELYPYTPRGGKESQ